MKNVVVGRACAFADFLFARLFRSLPFTVDGRECVRLSFDSLLSFNRRYLIGHSLRAHILQINVAAK